MTYTTEYDIEAMAEVMSPYWWGDNAQGEFPEQIEQKKRLFRSYATKALAASPVHAELARVNRLLQSAYDVMEQAVDDMRDSYSVCPLVKMWMLKWMDESDIRCESGHAPDIDELLKYDKEELARLKAENEKLKMLLNECANDLEAELRNRYCDDKGEIHPAMQRRFDRDMAPVVDAKQSLQQKGGGDASV